MLMLTSVFKFERLTRSHGSYSEHTGLPNAGALPGATLLPGREAAAAVIGVPGFPEGNGFEEYTYLGFLNFEVEMGLYCTIIIVLPDG